MLDQNNPWMQSALPRFCNRNELTCFVEQPNPTGRYPETLIDVCQIVSIDRLTVRGTTPSSTRENRRW